MLESFTYLDWSSLLIHLSGIISYISLETQLLQDVMVLLQTYKQMNEQNLATIL